MFFKDLIETVKITPVWFLMAKYDIISRYRRTAFGPWWITLGTGCALLGMGLVWSTLFKMEIKDLFPYFSIGFVFFTFISSSLTEGPLILISNSHVPKTIKIPILTFIFNSLLKNIIMLLHNFVIVIIVFIVFKIKLTLTALLFFPGIMLLFLTSFCISLILALLGAKLRDLSHIISSLMTFIFMLTPIVWREEMLLGKQKLITYLNPITHFIIITRDPLIDKIPSPIYYYGALSIFSVCVIVSIILYNKSAKNIIYWV